MSVQHTAIFHCQTCGRMVYQPHGSAAPTCCCEPMVCAVADVVRDPQNGTAVERSCANSTSVRRPGDVKGDALTQEVRELSNWCRSVVEEDGGRYPEFARRLRSLHDVLLDRFNAEERTDARVLAGDNRFGRDVTRLNQQQRDLLESLDHLIHDLHQGESCFRGWVEVCERFDSFVDDYQRHERAESDLERTGLKEALGTVDCFARQ